MKTRIAALAPAGKAARSPPGSAASRCRSWSPVGSRSTENLISHLRQERWDVPRCHPGGSEALVPDPDTGCQLPAPAGDSVIPARWESFQHLNRLRLTQILCSALALTLLHDSRGWKDSVLTPQPQAASTQLKHLT